MTVITYALMPTHAYQIRDLEERFDHSVQEADYQADIFTAAESNIKQLYRHMRHTFSLIVNAIKGLFLQTDSQINVW